MALIPGQGHDGEGRNEDAGRAGPHASRKPLPLVDEARKEGAEESASGVCRVVESDIQSGFVGIRIGQDKVGMERRVHGENDSEKNESAEDGLGEVPLELHAHRDGDGYYCQGNSPGKSGRCGACHVSILFGYSGSGGLHDSVSDDPDRHEGSDRSESPSKLCAQEYRQGDDEPNIAGGEEEEAGERQNIDFAGF